MGNGADRLGGGAGRQWRTEQMEKKGSEVGDRRLLKALGARGGEGKGGGVGSVPRGGRRRSGEGPGTVVGSAERLAVALGHQAWVAALWHDRGGRRGTIDSARAADRRNRAAAGPGGQWRSAGGRGGSEAVVASGTDRQGRPAQCRV
jgi:hypothetical protein